jgi:hypothetical protein
VHVKEGGGAVLRCRNARTGKEEGVVFWGADERGSAGTGFYNPAAFAQSNDFEVGDEIVLLDFEPAALEPFAGLVSSTELDLNGVYRLKEGTGTGWNLDAENLRFGRCGIVGDWWKELSVEIEFRHEVDVGGIRTDSGVDLPYRVERLLEGRGQWELVQGGCTGNTRLDGGAVFTRALRLTWESTDMHKSGGLSTMRSGGGLHAEVWLAL